MRGHELPASVVISMLGATLGKRGVRQVSTEGHIEHQAHVHKVLSSACPGREAEVRVGFPPRFRVRRLVRQVWRLRACRPEPGADVLCLRVPLRRKGAATSIVELAANRGIRTKLPTSLVVPLALCIDIALACNSAAWGHVPGAQEVLAGF